MNALRRATSFGGRLCHGGARNGQPQPDAEQSA
jgi:hypothetical protein